LLEASTYEPIEGILVASNRIRPNFFGKLYSSICPTIQESMSKAECLDEKALIEREVIHM
jgi:hypothetical protein